jgi:DNA replication licensing factor MCM3
MVGFKEVVDGMADADNDPTISKKLRERDGINIGFEGSFGSNSVSPRGLVAKKLNQLVEVEGIVTKCSSVRPKLAKLVQYSQKNNRFSERQYRDATSLSIGSSERIAGGAGGVQMPTSSIIPSKDQDGNALEMEYGYCVYDDHQTITLQEMPERAKVGQLPRSVEVILEHDLVDRIKPGDRVLCVGLYRPLAGAVTNGQSSGSFKANIIACNLSIIGQEVGAVHLTGEDVKNIRELSSRSNILDLLSRSLCPSIFGHEFIKRALILQLLGGVEKNLENGTHLRGDINMMLVGDPSTAKSQLLRAVLDIAPLAISTTGRGSTGVGLTAAVTTDGESRDRRLEAGAMVLADRGIVCIDEFDKMGEADRVAIHEVMEQQTVTIAKAGIHASLNARCSVLAAANPVYGQYDKQKSPQANIGLPDSLLSRFDLLFVVLDFLDPTFDRVLSEHVIKSHQYRRPGTTMEPEPLNQVSSVSLDDATDSSRETLVWQRGGRGSDASFGDGREGDVLTKDFLRKFVHYAKSRKAPELTDEAMEIISSEYARMRSLQTRKNLPVTARSLETIIRISSASAKIRLSPSVDSVDVNVAMELLNFVLYHDVSAVAVNNENTPNITTGIKISAAPIAPINVMNLILASIIQMQEQGSAECTINELIIHLSAPGEAVNQQNVEECLIQLEVNNKVC